MSDVGWLGFCTVIIFGDDFVPNDTLCRGPKTTEVVRSKPRRPLYIGKTQHTIWWGLFVYPTPMKKELI